LRKLPSVDSLLQEVNAAGWAKGVAGRLVTKCVRQAVDEKRKEIAGGKAGATGADEVRQEILLRARALVAAAGRPHYRRAVNATGIILHTGLGRAVLAKKAIQQIANELSGYSVLQVDVETGERSKRDERIEWLLKELTGAEAATVVNNNSAATALVLNTFAKGKEVIVSRGQLVEIGGSFRLPEVMAASGAVLVEVGTTNKTHAKDYENAITPETAAILRVHPSNYKIVGFSAEVGLAEMVEIAHRRNVMLIDDVGSGALFDFGRFGFPDEPTLPGSIKAGADVVMASADKLIGGSQGGIILGKADLIAAVRKNPMARMMRVGKLTLAALEATLSLFLDEAEAFREVPTLAMLVRDIAELAKEAERIAAAIRRRTKAADVKVIDGQSQMGSGSLPTEDLPTRLVAITAKKMTPDELALALRRNEPPVVARIQRDAVLVDPRTLLEGDGEVGVEAVAKALGG
jgi:L-seryl-tRNA(Ser) seleniumtransferase